MSPSKQYLAKIRKACKAMKPYGISAGTVRSSLKSLLEVYENNWSYIEEDNYKVLLDAIFEPEGGDKMVENVKNDFKLVDESEEEGDEDEDEETEPLRRKPRLISETTSSTTAGYVCENEEELLCLEYYNTDSKANTNEDENEGEDIPPSPCSSEIDIASSSNGEVKLTFSICKPPPGFRMPNLDAVMKRIEETYQEKFQGFGKGFCLAQVLKDICDCFTEGNASDHFGNKHPSFDNSKEPEKQDGPSLTNDSIQTPRFVVASEFDHCFNGMLRKQLTVGIEGISFDNFKEPVKQDSHTDNPLQISTFVVSNKFDHCLSGRLRKQQMVGSDELLSDSSSLTIIPMEQSTVDLCSKHYWVSDITRGLEKQEISLVNEVDDEKLPTFTYIPTNVNYRNANVKFMLARISEENCCPNCFGDCLSPEIPCACAVETGGEFAYTTEGLLDEKFLEQCINITLKPTEKDYFYCDDCPLERMKKGKTDRSQSGSCKGHLVRRFIKECWYKCGCGYKCGNRVVQRGIQAKLQVFKTIEGKGWGLRTLEDLPRGAFVCEYVGEIVTNSELFERNEQNKIEEHTYPVLLDADWSSEGFLKDEEALCLDATSFGNVARFINHRCVDANMVEIPVEVESPDHHYYHHAFFTTREVKAMEELTWDYGIDFDDDSHPVNAFSCKCGSKFCKAVKHKKRSRLGQ